MEQIEIRRVVRQEPPFAANQRSVETNRNLRYANMCRLYMEDIHGISVEGTVLVGGRKRSYIKRPLPNGQFRYFVVFGQEHPVESTRRMLKRNNQITRWRCAELVDETGKPYRQPPMPQVRFQVYWPNLKAIAPERWCPIIPKPWGPITGSNLLYIETNQVGGIINQQTIGYDYANIPALLARRSPDVAMRLPKGEKERIQAKLTWTFDAFRFYFRLYLAFLDVRYDLLPIIVMQVDLPAADYIMPFDTTALTDRVEAEIVAATSGYADHYNNELKNAFGLDFLGPVK